MKNEVIVGDCLDVMRYLESETFNTCVTSPPYFGLRDYGHEGQIGLEETPDEYVARLVEVFREVRRVLRDDGTLWLNLGDSYGPTKQLIGIPWSVAFALQADGWYLRQDIIWHKPNPMPESVRDRCTKAHEYIFLLSKSPRYYFDSEAIKEQATSEKGKGATGRGKQGSALAVGANGRHPQQDHSGWLGGDGETRNKRSVWTVSTKPFKGAHFATFPPNLIEPCILAGSPVGGCVLDPFGGAGTTGVTSRMLGRSSTLIEINPDYADIARKRIYSTQSRLI